jgi:hypothetical protein
MTKQATGTFEVKSWDEKPVDEREGLPKLTRATVTQSLHGDIEGESTVEYLMVYRDDGSANVTGIQRVIGSIGGRSGSFVLIGTGTFDHATGIAKGAWTIVPYSGTGELRVLRGQGEYFAQKEPKGSLMLEYDLD